MNLLKIRKVIKEKGLLHIIGTGKEEVKSYLRKFSHLMQYYYIKTFRSSRNFFFNGKKYDYFIHPVTWRNERTVEIPIVLEILNRYNTSNVLEVGNVLSYYSKVDHDIVDKYDTENV
jgi:hypothetical protein